MGGRSFEPPIGEPGYSRLLAPDRRPYKTLDGYVCTLVYTDGQWRSFYRAIGKTDAEFAADPRLQTQHERSKHYAALYKLVADELAKRTTAEWIELFSKHDIPVGPLNDLDGLIDDQHLAEVGFFREIDHPTEGPLRLVGIPSQWERSQPDIGCPPPNLGEHTREVLSEFGFNAGEIEALLASGAARESERAKAVEPAS
jgi:crotonobetainyl-CoA:carnitine CoA-transferase CaiB-like acyl-CoA transferase